MDDELYIKTRNTKRTDLIYQDNNRIYVLIFKQIIFAIFVWVLLNYLLNLPLFSVSGGFGKLTKRLQSIFLGLLPITTIVMSLIGICDAITSQGEYIKVNKRDLNVSLDFFDKIKNIVYRLEVSMANDEKSSLAYRSIENIKNIAVEYCEETSDIKFMYDIFRKFNEKLVEERPYTEGDRTYYRRCILSKMKQTATIANKNIENEAICLIFDNMIDTLNTMCTTADDIKLSESSLEKIHDTLCEYEKTMNILEHRAIEAKNKDVERLATGQDEIVSYGSNVTINQLKEIQKIDKDLPI